MHKNTQFQVKILFFWSLIISPYVSPTACPHQSFLIRTCVPQNCSQIYATDRNSLSTGHNRICNEMVFLRIQIWLVRTVGAKTGKEEAGKCPGDILYCTSKQAACVLIQ